MARRNWQREELILAFNLYCKTPFGRIHNRNPDIISLAEHIERSPSAVSWKLANFARLDPTIRARNLTGATHGGKGEIEIWEEFNGDWDSLVFESERLLAQTMGRSIEEVAEISEEELLKEGKERERVVRSRVNQQFFRATVLAAYEYKCCVTGLPLPELLTASHIVPWAVDHANRLNPQNGLCLNAMHDRAFDRGFLTITPDYKVKLATAIKDLDDNEAVRSFLLQYDSLSITLPNRFVPDPIFLEYHNRNIFLET
jgi:putative restriction endonuclease